MRISKVKHLFLYIFLTSLILLNQGCNLSSNVSDSNIPVIDIKNGLGSGKILNLKDYVESIHYVKLNTTEENLLTEITEFIYEDGMFIILDKEKDAKLFREDGSFIKTIGKIGQGPREYVFCYGIDYLSEFKEIFLQAYNKLFFFDSNGNFKRIKQLNFETYNVHQILYFNQETFVADIYSTPNCMLKFIFFNDSLQIIKNFSNNNPLVNYNDRSWLAISSKNAVMYRFNNNFIHYKPYEDTIFRVDKEMNIKANYIIDYGKYKIFEDTYFDPVVQVYNIQESSDFLFLNIDAGRFAPEPIDIISPINGKHFTDGRVYGIYNKKNNKLTFLNQPEQGKLGFKNDVDGGLPFWPKYISQKGEMITYYQPYEFMDVFQNKEDAPEDVKAILKDLKNDDNPIVVIAKIKQ